MAGLMIAASPVEIEAKADEANLPQDARQAALRLFHDLTSRLELASIELDRADGEEWPRHRFYFGPEQGEVARLLDALRGQPDTAELTSSSSGAGSPDTLFITGSDGAFAAVLIACADSGLLRSAAQRIEAQLPGPTPQ
jgi:hypothetical protein